jgi:hypothetical protein
MQRTFRTFLRLFLGLFLLAAGIGKGLDISGYADVIVSYDAELPMWANWAAAIAITAFETALGAWILSGWRLAPGALLSSALHTAYFIFLAITLLRGVDVPNCGCFGVFFPRPLEPFTLVEDAVLVALSLGLYLLARKRVHD